MTYIIQIQQTMTYISPKTPDAAECSLAEQTKQTRYIRQL